MQPNLHLFATGKAIYNVSGTTGYSLTFLGWFPSIYSSTSPIVGATLAGSMGILEWTINHDQPLPHPPIPLHHRLQLLYYDNTWPIFPVWDVYIPLFTYELDQDLHPGVLQSKHFNSPQWSALAYSSHPQVNKTSHSFQSPLSRNRNSGWNWNRNRWLNHLHPKLSDTI